MVNDQGAETNESKLGIVLSGCSVLANKLAIRGDLPESVIETLSRVSALASMLAERLDDDSQAVVPIEILATTESMAKELFATLNRNQISTPTTELQAELRRQEDALLSSLSGMVIFSSYPPHTAIASLIKRVDQKEAEARALIDVVKRANNILTEEVKQEARNQVTQAIEDFDKWRNERDTEFSGVYQEMIGYKRQAMDIVEVVSAEAHTEQYQKLRESQFKVALCWGILGVGVLIILVAMAGFSFFGISFLGLSAGVSNAWDAIARSGFLLALAGFATYALRQFGHHRQQGEEATRIINELVMLWPFLNRLDEEEKKIVLSVITPRYFRGGLLSRSGNVPESASGGLANRLGLGKRPIDEE